jgi:hypothetical protein
MALLASSASNKLTFKRTGESFEEREIQSKVCCWAKISKKKHFFINRLQLKRFKPGFLDSSKYFTSTNSKNFLGNSLIFKILHKFERAEKNFALWLLKKVLYNCSTFWKHVLFLNFRYCWKFLAFFLVEIQLFSGRKQTSFRCRIFHSIRTWRPSWVASKMAAKLSFQFP